MNSDSNRAQRSRRGGSGRSSDSVVGAAAATPDDEATPDQTMAALGRALLRAPSDRAMLDELEQLAELTGAYAALAEIYRTVASRPLTLEQQVDLRCRLGRLYAAHLNEPDRAVATYRRVLDLAPTRADVAASLERLYVATRRWDALLEYLAERGARDQLIEVLAGHVAGAADAPGPAIDPVASFLEISRLCEQRLDDPYRAIDAADRALSLDPGSLDALRTLARLYREIDAHERCLDMLDLELGTVTDDGERIAVLREMARLCEDELDDIDRAAECFENILLVDETCADAHRRLAACYRRTAAWDELAECLERHAALEPEPAIAAELWGSVARLHRDELDDGDRAAGALLQQARVIEVELGDVAGALAVYQELLTLESGFAAAREALERLLRDPDHAITAARVLEPLFEDREDEGALLVCEVLCDHAAAHATDPWRRGQLLHRIAHIQQVLGRPADALQTFGKLLAEGLADEAILDEMERLAADADRPALVRIYTRVVAGRADAETRGSLRCRLGRIFQQLGEPALAIESYRAALDLPGGVAAADALEELYARAGRWDELADHLRDRGSWDNLVDVLSRHLPDEPGAQVQRFLDVSRVCEQRLGDLDQAVEAAERALATARDARQTAGADDGAPDAEGEAMRALLALHRRMGAFERCLDVLELQLGGARDDRERNAVLGEMARLCADDLGDLDRAAECVEGILAIDGACVDAYRQLAGYYRRMTAWPALAACYRRHIVAEPDPAARLALQRQLAAVYEDEMLDDDAAAAVHAEILARSPDDADSRAALDRLRARRM